MASPVAVPGDVRTAFNNCLGLVKSCEPVSWYNVNHTPSVLCVPGGTFANTRKLPPSNVRLTPAAGGTTPQALSTDALSTDSGITASWRQEG